MAKGCLLIVQVGGKGGQTRPGVVYTSGKMDPPHREFAEMAACYTLSSASDLQRWCLDCDYAPPFVSSTCQRVIDLQDGLDIDRVARDVLDRRGARSNFLGYHGFPAVICSSVNDEIVHGIPSPKRVLRDGDIGRSRQHHDCQWRCPISDCRRKCRSRSVSKSH